MTVLITGANGFVGSALAKKLAEASCSTKVAVRNPSMEFDDLKSIDQVVVGSIGPETFWDEALADVETVVHLAARVHVMQDRQRNPLEEYRKVNVQGTVRLAREASRSGVKRLVFLSSVKVNGEGGDRSYRETDTPEPLDPYGVSKLEAEQALGVVSEETGLEIVIIRSPLVYGPGVKANFVKMLQWIEKGVPLPLAGVKNRRSMIYLGNLVDCIELCMTHERAAGELFLVSDNRAVSTPELLRLSAEALGRNACLFWIPQWLLKLAGLLLRRSEIIQRLTGSLTVSNEKVETVLGWKPPYTIQDGLRMTADWYRAQRP